MSIASPAIDEAAVLDREWGSEGQYDEPELLPMEWSPDEVAAAKPKIPWVCMTVDSRSGRYYLTHAQMNDGRPVEPDMDAVELAEIIRELRTDGWARRWRLLHPARDETHRAMLQLARKRLPLMPSTYEIVSDEII